MLTGWLNSFAVPLFMQTNGGWKRRTKEEEEEEGGGGEGGHREEMKGTPEGKPGEGQWGSRKV